MVSTLVKFLSILTIGIYYLPSRCMTENHYGNQLKDAPEYAQPNADKFVECAFQDL